MYSQNETEPSELVEARYRIGRRSSGQKLMDVMVPPWPVKTATCLKRNVKNVIFK